MIYLFVSNIERAVRLDWSYCFFLLLATSWNGVVCVSHSFAKVTNLVIYLVEIGIIYEMVECPDGKITLSWVNVGCQMGDYLNGYLDTYNCESAFRT